MNIQINEVESVIRMGLSFIVGGVIGLERSSRRQIAGIRTHVLICMGGCLLMLLSIWMSQHFGSGDPGRIAAQVVSGIGFLGAGAIIRLGNNIKGLTTAASLWLIAAIGLALGAGMYIAAFCTAILSLITLIVLDRIENKLFPTTRNKFLELYYKKAVNPDIEKVRKIISDFGIKYLSMDVNQKVGKNNTTKIRFLVVIPDSANLTKLAKVIKTADDVIKVEIKEKY